jgi:hypothetical protein
MPKLIVLDKIFAKEGVWELKDKGYRIVIEYLNTISSTKINYINLQKCYNNVDFYNLINIFLRATNLNHREELCSILSDFIKSKDSSDYFDLNLYLSEVLHKLVNMGFDVLFLGNYLSEDLVVQFAKKDLDLDIDCKNFNTWLGFQQYCMQKNIDFKDVYLLSCNERYISQSRTLGMNSFYFLDNRVVSHLMHSVSLRRL